VPETRVRQVCYTTCRMVPETHTRTVRQCRVHYVPEEKVCQIPYTTCRLVPETCVRNVCRTVCEMQPYCETYTTCRLVPVCEPVCVDPCNPCGVGGHASWKHTFNKHLSLFHCK
jgi:hypothetical protein